MMSERDGVINDLSKKVMLLSYELAKARCINTSIMIGIGVGMIYFSYKKKKQEKSEE